MFTIFSVFNILIAAAMTILILMQRGEGAGAGAGFGGGASATVFGARGSSSFMTKATGVLAGAFFLLSLAMGMYLSNNMHKGPDQSLGVMAGVATPGPSASVSLPPQISVPAAANAVPKAATPTPAATPAKTPASAVPAPATTTQ
ncbi:MAG: preprotein translocase subunit SecG [Xanthomonadales bacterium]|nr:preprotein translocase subunit SecG [Xanthomonadales bacterium]